jgi:NADH-quinone oxidoreductase subunit J
MTADFAVLAAETAYRTSTAEEVTFWVLAVLAVLGALAVVAAPKAVYSAIFLAVVMIIVAVLYIAQDALFLGIVMLIGVDSADSLVETIRGQRIAACVAGAAFGILLIGGIGNVSVAGFSGLTEANSGGNVQGLAALIFTRYLWAFELTSALLITAALGAMLLAHRERFDRRKTQRELAIERFAPGGHPTPRPSPGVYARHNAVDMAARLPDGSDANDSVSAILPHRSMREESPSNGTVKNNGAR